MQDRIPDVLFVLAIAFTFGAVSLLTMLIAAILGNQTRTVPWTRFAYVSLALWIVWVMIR